MKRPLALMFAFTLLALPIACGDDDDEDPDGGTGGATTGGSTAKGGSTTGGKASGGTAGKASGGTAGKASGGTAGTPTTAGAGGVDGEGGEAGGGPIPEGGVAGAAPTPEGGAGGAAGGGTVPPEGGTAGATDPPSEGGTAGAGEEPSEGGTAGAAEPTAEELMDIICAKTPGGDECTEPSSGACVEGLVSVFRNGSEDCADGWEDESLAVLNCAAVADDDELICGGNGVEVPVEVCLVEQCALFDACYGPGQCD
jgi:hypothetical protein